MIHLEGDVLILRVRWGGREDPVPTQADMIWETWQRLVRYGGLLAKPWSSLGGTMKNPPPSARRPAHRQPHLPHSRANMVPFIQGQPIPPGGSPWYQPS